MEISYSDVDDSDAEEGDSIRDDTIQIRPSDVDPKPDDVIERRFPLFCPGIINSSGGYVSAPSRIRYPGVDSGRQ